MSNRVLAVAVAIILGVPLIFIQLSNSHGTQSAKDDATALYHDALFAACRGGNLRSAYELANHDDGHARQQLAQDLLPIINCDVLVEKAERIAIPLDVQHEYIRTVVRDRRWPILKDGVIVGSEPLPGLAPRQGDEDSETATVVLP